MNSIQFNNERCISCLKRKYYSQIHHSETVFPLTFLEIIRYIAITLKEQHYILLWWFHINYIHIANGQTSLLFTIQILNISDLNVIRYFWKKVWRNGCDSIKPIKQKYFYPSGIETHNLFGSLVWHSSHSSIRDVLYISVKITKQIVLGWEYGTWSYLVILNDNPFDCLCTCMLFTFENGVLLMR